MEICSNKDIEGKINKISYKEQNSNEFFSNYKDYKIGINLDHNETNIIISIFERKDINERILQKYFSFEEIFNFDVEFFEPFNNNILILFKFITRLLLANLIDFKVIKEGDKNLYYLNLNCLKDSCLRTITIDLNDDHAKEINKGSAPAVENNNKAIKVKMNDNKKNNQKYLIELRKIEHEYENSEIYKEIEIKFTNIKENRVYYDYLNCQDIFDSPIPYYQLFNGSIEDVYDDLNIIIFHNNYKFEENKYSIKFWFQVFNIGKSSIEPYFFIFIEALNRRRLDIEFQSKMKEYFQNKLKKAQHSEKNENNDEQSLEKSKKDNKKTKKQINPQILFMQNFLSMKSLNSEENKNNNKIKIENKENKEKKNINENNKNIIEKNKINTFNEPNIKNNSKIFFNCNLIEKENKTDKIDSFLSNQKNLTDLKIDNFFIKRKRKEDNNECNLNNNNNRYNNNKNDNIKKSNNNSLEIEEKKEDKKFKVDKSQKEINMKSENEKMNFSLDENGCYNINIDEVNQKYLQLLYVHPLDNDKEIKNIKNEGGEQFYLCTICDTFFNSKNLVREHQWKIHLKPFGEAIQKELKSRV